MQGLGAQELAAAAPVMLASASAVPVGRASFDAPSQRLWANTWRYDGRTNGNRNVAKVDQSGTGLALGGDVRINDQFSVGALFGYEDDKVKNGGTRRSRTDVDAYSLGGYVNADVGRVALSGGLIYSHLKFDSSRTILLPASKAKASYDGYKVQAFVEAAQSFEAGDATVTPYANLTQSWLHTDAVCEVFPHMAGAVVNRGWAGIEACMPDEIPVIGASRRRENAFHAFGFSAHGFELGPIVGSIMADLITRGETALPIAPFDIQRFGYAATALPTIHPQGATEHE